jgi:hypothetical protein
LTLSGRGEDNKGLKRGSQLLCNIYKAYKIKAYNLYLFAHLILKTTTRILMKFAPESVH